MAGRESGIKVPDVSYEVKSVALWAVAILATACVVLLSRPLSHSPRWRAALIGTVVTFISAPVYSIAFDPWWQYPWPSIHNTTALVGGDFQAAWSYVEFQFVLPPVGWGILTALAWIACSAPPRSRSSAPP